MRRFPPDSIKLTAAAKKYGFNSPALRRAVERKRLEGFQEDGTWFTTHSAMRKYLKNRHEEKIPKKYRKKS